ncbi:hypothetical protein Caci_0246 [Catenulispora acidiphila DSM 44928]|uniref:Uncharacterized protein n=1 Tax=Catenulispora acidiphila (strain DSM 44928 / JCM 14897 / NBRC 102108 / NRRL B-24433 / ID139908) TaxID=479433 RepID=C7QJ57_CATAD|nr:hypothetical protein [Catenulispora acidiphila]ACU69199.1 hypothetical protein Caci_0246 [Catenulispora acidiphila DSM 44928]
METENPDTGRMHQLFGAALDDVDLTGDVVPNVLTGYAHKVKVRRYQGAGVAVAALAAAGIAVNVLPHGTGGAPPTTSSATPVQQSPDYCQHQQWVRVSAGVVVQNGNVPLAIPLSPDPRADQASCDALQKALHAVFPEARLIPAFNPDLTRDPRLDQARVRTIEMEETTDPNKWSADLTKYFGSELTRLAAHPEDPVNVYMPGQYTLVTPGVRESFGVAFVTAAPVANAPESFVGSVGSEDCEKMPAALKDKDQCTSVGVSAGWHGALWNTPAQGVNAPEQTVVLTNGSGTRFQLNAHGTDDSARGIAPSGNALTDEQWARLVASPALQKYADDYFGKAPVVPHSTPSPTHSR